MRGIVPPDPETKVSEENYAVVYTQRKARKRFPQGCVELKPSAEDARAEADEGANRYAARVVGPSKSSEGQYIFYLVEWL